MRPGCKQGVTVSRAYGMLELIPAPQDNDKIAPQPVCHAPVRLCEYAQVLVQEITYGRDAYLWTVRRNSL